MIEIELYLARDKKGDLHLFKNKPYKTTHGYWRDDVDGEFAGAWVNHILESESCYLDKISWEDDEPCKVILTT